MNASALLQGALVFLLACLFFRQKISLWLLARPTHCFGLGPVDNLLKGGSYTSPSPETQC